MKNAILLLVICLAGAVNTMAQIKDTDNTSKFIIRDSKIYTVAITTSSGESYRYVYTPDMVFKDTYEEEWSYIDEVLELNVSGDVVRDDVTIHELEWFVAGGDRKVLIEQFTSSACSPCATTNAWLNSLLENNADKVVVVKYPMYFPGVGDPYYTPEGGVRKDYYNAISVPQVFVDGSNANGELAIQEAIDAAYALPSSVGIAGTFTVDGNNISIAGDVTPYVSGSGYKLYVTVNEKKTSNNTGSNGETEFHHVMMKMFPDGGGEEITLSAGIPVPFDFTCDMSSTHVEDIGDLEVVVFVQEISTKAVLNAAYLENSTLQTAVFTWDAVAGEKSFGPMAPLGMEFAVGWGDGSTTTETGTGKREEVTHTYAAAGSYDVTVTGNTITSLDFMNKQLTAIDLSACPNLLYLFCEVNELTSLDLSACTKLENLYCFGNHLPLSDLYAASLKIATQNSKRLGTQLLNPQIVQTGDEIDYSSQNEFGGIYTDFLVEKEGAPAVLDTDYTQTDGKITFFTAGDYTVTMTNAAIVSHASYPAKVIATLRVENNEVTPPFVAVTDITDVPETAIAGTLLELTATINPVDATNQDIVWTVKDAGTTGASIAGNTLNTAAAGTVTVTATITDGMAVGTDYEQDFSVTVSDNTPLVDAEAPVITQHPENITTEMYDIVVLQVTANSSDGGVLSYQWYYHTINRNYGGTFISGATSAYYNPPTNTEGTMYYYVVVTNTNNSVNGTTTASVTSDVAAVTVNMPAPVYYNISIGIFTGGAVHTDAYTSIEGETVTLTILPDEDYELSSIEVYRKDDVSTNIDLSGSEGIRTFTMPAFDVTVVATFEYTGVTTGIDETSQTKALRAWVQNGALHVDGLTEGKPWSVYNISGSLIYQNIADSNEAEISLPVRGMYIVTSEKVSVKVMN